MMVSSPRTTSLASILSSSRMARQHKAPFRERNGRRRGSVRDGKRAGAALVSRPMGVFSGPMLASLLDAERDLLDEIFGKGAWRIESSEARQATVRSGLLDAHFGWERDSSIGALIDLHDVPEGTSGEAETWLWSKYLGLDTPPRPKDRHGRVL